jgi:ganglioside-induced differentiation-associated protein 1
MTESTESSGAKPRLYHTPSSYYSMIARLALAEGGVAYEPVFVDIHFRRSQQRPDYVRLNPNMTVPTLALANRILDQSRDIAEFALGVGEATLDGYAKAWLDLHYGYPIEELTFGGFLARNPMARIMIPKLLRSTHRRLLAFAAKKTPMSRRSMRGAPQSSPSAPAPSIPPRRSGFRSDAAPRRWTSWIGWNGRWAMGVRQ